MLRPVPLLLVLSLLSACGLSMPFGRDDAPADPAITVTEEPGDDVLHPRARTPAEEAAAPQHGAPAPAADGFLGETLAGLGAPGERGLWVSTGLVSSARAGRVITAGGQSLGVELRPSGTAPGAGSQISLQAMQALGLPLSGLATLRVYVE